MQTVELLPNDISNLPLLVRFPPILRVSVTVGFIESGTAVPEIVAATEIVIDVASNDDTVAPERPVPEIFHNAAIPAVELTLVMMLEPEVISPDGVSA